MHLPSTSPRLAQQLGFIIELDKLKNIVRATRLMDNSRRENSAEHSWHLALMATVLAEHAAQPVDVGRVVQMLLVHDIVEIDAGDTFAYDVVGNLSKAAREQRAAERLFGLLPAEQGPMFRALWEEFELVATAEARFANALDRLEPLLQNSLNQGGTWSEFAVTHAAVLRRMAPIEAGMPALWPFVLELIEAACAAGYIRTDDSVES